MLCLNENFPQLVAQAPNVTLGFTPAGISVSRQGGHRVNQNISVVGMRGTSNNCTLDGGLPTPIPISTCISGSRRSMLSRNLRW